MKNKLIFFILLLCGLYYMTLYNVDVDIEPDIIISPGGYKGFYQLGICHYIKNHFNYSNKKIFGFSAGSWLGLFLCLDNKHSNECIRSLFKQSGYCCPLPKMPNYFKKSISKFKEGDFNLSNLYVGMTNIENKSMYLKNNFLSTSDCLQSCIGSSFVPMVTYRDIIYFYNHRNVIDGGVCYRKYIKKVDTNKVLVIRPSLFRHNQKKSFDLIRGFFKPKRSLYESYILGYKNARDNHDYLKKYFHSDS